MKKTIEQKEQEYEEIQKLVDELQDKLNKYNADEIKIYFADKTDFTVKFIKAGEIINAIRKRNTAEFKFVPDDAIPRHGYMCRKEA